MDEARSPCFSDRFEILQTIQKAIFGEVVRARCRRSENLRAVKIITKSLANQRRSRTGCGVFESADVELHLLRLLRDAHPHPLCLSLSPEDEQMEDTARRYVVMPLAAQGDLFTYIERNNGLPEPECKRIFADVAIGLHHLHTVAGYAHNDISLENVLLTDEGRAMICDYGLSLPIGAPWDRRRRMSGKLPYQAPEIFFGRASHAHGAVDVFSLGVMLFVGIFGTPPFEKPDRATDKRFAYMQEDRLQELLEIWQVEHLASPQLVQLLQGMLREEPQQRLSLAQVMAHPWFAPAVAERQRAAEAAMAAALPRAIGRANSPRPATAPSASSAPSTPVRHGGARAVWEEGKEPGAEFGGMELCHEDEAQKAPAASTPAAKARVAAGSCSPPAGARAPAFFTLSAGGSQPPLSSSLQSLSSSSLSSLTSLTSLQSIPSLSCLEEDPMRLEPADDALGGNGSFEFCNVKTQAALGCGGGRLWCA